MSTTSDWLILIAAFAVSGVGLYIATGWVLRIARRGDRLACTAALFGVAALTGLGACRLTRGQWLQCRLRRTPLEGQVLGARAITRVAPVYCGVMGHGAGRIAIMFDEDRSLYDGLVSGNCDDWTPEGRIVQLCGERSLIGATTPHRGGYWPLRKQFEAAQSQEQLYATYLAERGVLIEYTDGAGQKLVYVLLRRRDTESKPTFGWKYHEEIIDYMSEASLASADFGCGTGPLVYLNTPVALVAASCLEVLALALGMRLRRWLPRTTPGGFPVIVTQQQAQSRKS